MYNELKIKEFFTNILFVFIIDNTVQWSAGYWTKPIFIRIFKFSSPGDYGYYLMFKGDHLL